MDKEKPKPKTPHEKLLEKTKEAGILLWPHDNLKMKSSDSPGLVWGPDLQAFATSLKKACNDVSGAGLTACQIGGCLRLSVMATPNEPPLTFWNPDLILFGQTKRVREGCISMPGVFGDVVRFKNAILVAETPAGPIRKEFRGFAAQVLQHEVDHMDGRMFFESAKPKERKRILKLHDEVNLKAMAGGKQS